MIADLYNDILLIACKLFESYCTWVFMFDRITVFNRKHTSHLK